MFDKKRKFIIIIIEISYYYQSSALIFNQNIDKLSTISFLNVKECRSNNYNKSRQEAEFLSTFTTEEIRLVLRCNIKDQYFSPDYQ